MTSPMFTRQSLPTGQRTLVTVVTNAEPLPADQRTRQNGLKRFFFIKIFII
jgi:hypothetical protein